MIKKLISSKVKMIILLLILFTLIDIPMGYIIYTNVNNKKIVYGELVDIIYRIPDYYVYIAPLGVSKLEKDEEVDLNIRSGVEYIISKFSESDWVTFIESLPEDNQKEILKFVESIN